MTKTKTSHAQCAEQIRSELKKVFPEAKFRVNSRHYSGGSSVYVSWIDGPTFKDVKAIAQKYQYGHFNGMEDIYEYSNRRNDITQVQFVHCERHFSETLLNQCMVFMRENVEKWKEAEDLYIVCKTIPDRYGQTGYTHPVQWLRTALWDADLTKNFTFKDLLLSKW